MSVSKLKIALVVDHFLPRIGGIELQVRDLAVHLAKQGHELHILTTTPGEKDLEEFADQNILVHRLPAQLMPGFKILYRARDLKVLEENLKLRDYDVVHAHGSVVSPLAYSALKIAHLLEIPSVLTIHSLLENSTRPLKFLFERHRGSHWHWQPTAVSSAVAQGLQKIVGKQEIQILPNGIELKNWSIKQEPHSELNVICVSRLNKKKRVQALLRQLPKILSQVKNPHSIHFHLVGTGPNEKNLKTLAKRLALGSYVHFHGYQSRSQIQQLFAVSDLFVMPAKKESFGIAILEARAAGLPVVALSYGGPKDLITSGENGILADNDEEMGAAIVELLNNTEKRQHMAAQSRVGLESYDWSEVIKRHEKIYYELIQSI